MDIYVYIIKYSIYIYVCVYVLIVYIIPIVMYSEMVLQSNLQLGWHYVVEMNFCVLQNAHTIDWS